MSLSPYEEAVRKYKEDGFFSIVSSGYYFALAKLAQRSPALAGFFTPKLTCVDIELTNACNLRCKMCPRQNPVLEAPPQRGFMEFETYRKIVDELSTYGYRFRLWLNLGGESLLHKDFLRMVDYAASKGVFQIGFSTNGMLLNEALIEALIDLEIYSIRISLDGLGKINDTIRVGADYEVIRRNILDLLEKRGDRRRPQVDLQLTWSTQSENDVLEFVRFWTVIVDHVWVYPCQSEELQVVKPTFFDEASTEKNRVCPWPFYYIAVCWNGDVVPCCHGQSGVNALGNASKDAIANIWRSEPYRALRRAAASATFPPQSRCHNCSVEKIGFRPSSRKLGEIRVSYSGLGKKYERT